MTEQLKRHVTLRNLTFLLSLVLFVWLVWYFYTGFGGPSLLATQLVPLALALQILFLYQQDYLYKRLPPLANHLLVTLYLGICCYGFIHFLREYEEIAIWRQGSYTQQDFIVGLLMFLLVMELSRLAHPILFWVNLVLVVYTLYGYLFPRWLDFFWHPGVSFRRIVTSSTVELATGIYGLYSQLALTLIAAFLLLAAAARGFEAQGAMVAVMRRLAGRSRHTVPQTAVLASVSIGMVSGSGSANTAVTGSFTIPLMKRYGVSPAFAGAVETGASMGGLVMPPLMAAAGFLMAEFLGVPYWDVVIRAFSISFIYFSALSLAVYLVSVRMLPGDPVRTPAVARFDQVKTAVFFLAVLYLIVLMGWFGTGALLAALYTGILMFALLLATNLFFALVLKDPAARGDPAAKTDDVAALLFLIAFLVLAFVFRDSPRLALALIVAAAGFVVIYRYVPNLIESFRITIETHAEMTSYLTLLLATLGIMIGLFTVTGFIHRMGGMLLQLGEWHIIGLILMAWVFGWLVGAGLPPTATYIVLAVIIVQPMQQVGINPWIAHFFCFLLAIWGELSPPTSLTAAVAARIADASFMRTMWEALRLCLPITFMSFAIFTRQDMLVSPGWPQILDTLLVAIGTAGVTLAIFGKLVAQPGSNIMLRAVLALASFGVMLHPDQRVAIALAVIVLPATALGVWRHRQIAPPETSPDLPPVDLGDVAEARPEPRP